MTIPDSSVLAEGLLLPYSLQVSVLSGHGLPRRGRMAIALAVDKRHVGQTRFTSVALVDKVRGIINWTDQSFEMGVHHDTKLELSVIALNEPTTSVSMKEDQKDFVTLAKLAVSCGVFLRSLNRYIWAYDLGILCIYVDTYTHSRVFVCMYLSTYKYIYSYVLIPH